MFVSFPNENSEGPSKAQLKKLAKEQYQKEQKALKAAGKDAPVDKKKEESKAATAESSQNASGDTAQPKD